MKTHIIQLHEHDNIFSTKDKMVWCKEPRVLLVAPPGERPVFSRVDLVRLQHYSKKLGVQLALVSRNADLQQNAYLTQIPVFESIEKAQRSTWRRRTTRKKITRPDNKPKYELLNHRRKINNLITANSILIRAAGFALGLLAVAAMLVFFIPGAEIILPITKEKQTLDMAVLVNANINVPILSGEIPAYSREYVVEGSEHTQSTGMMTIPDKNAAGEVVFTNLTDQAIGVPKGTIVSTVSTIPIRFATTGDVSVPIGVDPTAKIQIEALEPGSVGNVKPGEIIAIEGAAGSKLTVTNPEPTSGGNVKSISSPSSEDYLLVKEKLENALIKKAADYFAQSLTPLENIVPGTLLQETTLSEKREPSEGTPADTLKLSLQARYKILIIKVEDVKQVVKFGLDGALPANYTAENEINLDMSDKTSSTGTVISWNIKASRLYHQQVSQVQVTSILAGKNPLEASKFLKEKYKLNSSPKITIIPAWWNRLPFLFFRIKVLA